MNRRDFLVSSLALAALARFTVLRAQTAGPRAALVIGVRLAILLPLAFVLNAWFLPDVLGLERPFQIALFTLLILPPPFIIPLYMKPDAADEKRYVNNVLTLYTVVTIVLFAVYFIANPQL